MWSNLHTHSRYCDGERSLHDYIEKALSLNMVSLGFSSHAPLPFGCKWCMNANHVTEYIHEINLLKASNQEIKIYSGMEIDYIPGVISPKDFKMMLDYTIGSIHFVNAHEDGSAWEIDGSHQTFMHGFENIYRNNIQEVISHYQELTREMIELARPDIVGHLDKIKIQNINNKLFDESDAWYREEYLKTLDVIEQAGTIVEVNTRGLYQNKSITPYPSPWLLDEIHKRNIPVTLSSDAHRPEELINCFEQTAGLLFEIGFRKLTILREGKWAPTDFTPHGLLI